jgi:hypothetical protein
VCGGGGLIEGRLGDSKLDDTPAGMTGGGC